MSKPITDAEAREMQEICNTIAKSEAGQGGSPLYALWEENVQILRGKAKPMFPRLLRDRKVAMEIIEAIENLNPAHCFKIAGCGQDNPLIPCCTLCKARALIAAVKGGE